MVTTFYPPYNFGGDGIFVRELARALVKLGHEVRVIHCEDAFRLLADASNLNLPARYKDNGVEVCRLTSPLGALSPLLTQQFGHPVLKSRQLRELLDDEFDVVNFHNISLIGGPSVLALGRAPVKLYTLHEHWLICATHVFWKNREKRCDSRQCLRCSIRSGIAPQLWRYTDRIRRTLGEIDLLIAPSRYTADQHLELYPQIPTRVVPLFSRVQPTWASNHARLRTGGRPMFLYTGRITASKGVHSVLEQFAELRDYDLVLAGGGDLLDRLRRRYAGCANIRFAGPLDGEKLVALYASAVALILPSIAPETFGLAAVEAMACGTPAIVRDSGGCAEIVESTGAGFVYGKPDELPPLLRRLAADQTLQEHMSGLARAGYTRLFTRRRYLADYLAIVAEILARKSAGHQRTAAGNGVRSRSHTANGLVP